MFLVPNRLGDVIAARFRIRCDLQHHSTTDAAVSAHGVHGVVRRHGLPGHAYVPPSSAYGLAPYRVSSLWSRLVSASLPEISAGLLLPLTESGPDRCEIVRKTGWPIAVTQVTVDRLIPLEISSRAPFRNAAQNRDFDQTDGTFTVFVKLTVCVDPHCDSFWFCWPSACGWKTHHTAGGDGPTPARARDGPTAETVRQAIAAVPSPSPASTGWKSRGEHARNAGCTGCRSSRRSPANQVRNN